MTCTVICCKKCCCYNTCNRFANEGKKRNKKVVLIIKEPEFDEQKIRRPNQEGKKGKNLNENKDDDEVSYYSCGASTIKAEGKLKLWDSIINKLPGSREPAKPFKCDSYDIFNEAEDNIIEYATDESSISEEEDKESVVTLSMAISSILPHAAYQFSSLGLDQDFFARFYPEGK
eukprot:UN10657